MSVLELTEDRIWLAFERPPHPDAVTYAANVADVRFVLEILQRETAERGRVGRELSVFLEQIRNQNPFQRPQVPVRGEAGLYHLVPWRLAQWLTHCCRVCPSALERTCQRLERWLHERAPTSYVEP